MPKPKYRRGVPIPVCPVCRCRIPHGSSKVKATVSVRERCGPSNRLKTVKRPRWVHPSCASPDEIESRMSDEDMQERLEKGRAKYQRLRAQVVGKTKQTQDPVAGRDLTEAGSYNGSSARD